MPWFDDYPPAPTPMTVAYIQAVIVAGYQRDSMAQRHCRIVSVALKGVGGEYRHIALPNSRKPRHD